MCALSIGKDGSHFLHQFENTVVLQRTFIHLISTSIESHNGDDATKEKFHDTIGNQSQNLPVCSAVPQPTAPPRAPGKTFIRINSVRSDNCTQCL
jgi:hypothetical protein